MTSRNPLGLEQHNLKISVWPPSSFTDGEVEGLQKGHGSRLPVIVERLLDIQVVDPLAWALFQLVGTLDKLLLLFVLHIS